jgi:hypothetical protein
MTIWYFAIGLGIVQGLAMVLALAALRAASRADRELESERPGLSAA